MRCNLTILLITPVLAIFFMANHPAIGGETAIGKISRVDGEINILRSDGREVKGTAGLSLYPGDRITTGKGGMVLFSLQQEREFRLAEEAEMSVDELSGSDEEDDQPVLRLVLGYLWSKIRKIGGRPGGLELHTPTAVVGVRGTEFDTVVSLDAASVVAVDEGRVAVEAEDEEITLDEGKMTTVEADVRPTPPAKAVPKEKRDWKAWRKKRIKRLLKNLPRMAPRFRMKFERAVDRFTNFTARIKESSAKLATTMDKVRQARRDRDRKKFRQSVQRLRKQVVQFKKMAARFRKGMNRVRVMGRISHRVEKFATRNKDRFTDREFATIESNLAAISQKRVQLKSIIRRTIFGIKKTFKELRELKKEIKTASHLRSTG